ncbi:MAG: OmpH family outer membrane protein [Mangrovibacterium sp.]
MKNSNLILNVVLIIAVITLFALHFTSNKQVAGNISSNLSSRDITIAYVNTDSILLNYELSQVLHEEFTKNQTSYTDEYSKKRSAWESKAARFQEKLQRGGFLTEQRANEEREQLTNEQNDLVKLDHELSTKLSDMQNENSSQLVDSIMSAIKRYNKDKKYSYIFSASGVLIGDGSTNITADILKMMNDEYAH